MFPVRATSWHRGAQFSARIHDRVRAGIAHDAIDLARNRTAAAELDAAEPAWHLWYAPGDRRFYAFPLWDPGTSLVLVDTDPATLTEQMRQTERDYAEPRYHASPTGHGVSWVAREPRSGAGKPPVPPCYGDHDGRGHDGRFTMGLSTGAGHG